MRRSTLLVWRKYGDSIMCCSWVIVFIRRQAGRQTESQKAPWRHDVSRIMEYGRQITDILSIYLFFACRHLVSLSRCIRFSGKWHQMHKSTFPDVVLYRVKWELSFGFERFSWVSVESFSVFMFFNVFEILTMTLFSMIKFNHTTELAKLQCVKENEWFELLIMTLCCQFTLLVLCWNIQHCTETFSPRGSVTPSI